MVIAVEKRGLLYDAKHYSGLVCWIIINTVEYRFGCRRYYAPLAMVGIGGLAVIAEEWMTSLVASANMPVYHGLHCWLITLIRHNVGIHVSGFG